VSNGVVFTYRLCQNKSDLNIDVLVTTMSASTMSAIVVDLRSETLIRVRTLSLSPVNFLISLGHCFVKC
jgi:hypothetical protein